MFPGGSLLAVEAKVQYNRYINNAGLNDTTTGADVHAELDYRTQLQIRYDLDAVSAASFNQAQSKTHMGKRFPGSCNTCHPPTDALSGATANYTETRHGLNFGVTRKSEDGALSANVAVSRENDYASDGASLNWTADAGLKNTTMSLGIEYSRDRISAVTRSLDELLETSAVNASLTQIFSPSTVLSAGWSYAHYEGYQQCPYCFVQIGSDTDHPQRVNQPRQRSRQDLTATFKQGLWKGSAVQTDYRYYSDDWGVVAHTVELAFSQRIGWLVIEPNLRRYWQSQGAWFFKNSYAAPEEFRSRDLKLAPHNTRLLGITLRGKFSEHLGALLSASSYLREDSLDYSLYFAEKPENAQMLQLILTYE